MDVQWEMDYILGNKDSTNKKIVIQIGFLI